MDHKSQGMMTSSRLLQLSVVVNEAMSSVKKEVLVPV